MKDKLLYCCYSVPQRDYLTNLGIRYEICGLNPNTKCMFWAYLNNEKLSEALSKWINK